MKFLYMTDLHGKNHRYSLLLKEIKKRKVDIAILGGDLYPRGLSSVTPFLQGFLTSFFKKLDKLQVPLFLILGNDDYMCFDEDFQNLCDQFPYVHNITNTSVPYKGWDFLGLSVVPDYPFALKDRCRLDATKVYSYVSQLGPPCITEKEEGKPVYTDINLIEYIESKPSIKDDLQSLPVPQDFKKAVYVIHTPPTASGLDVTSSYDRVGSKAVYSFIRKNRPFLTLHGHVHESYRHSGVWKLEMERTTAINPGQEFSHTHYVLGDLEKNTYELIFQK